MVLRLQYVVGWNGDGETLRAARAWQYQDSRQEVSLLGVLGLRVGLAFVKEFCFFSFHVDIRRERFLSDIKTYSYNFGACIERTC